MPWLRRRHARDADEQSSPEDVAEAGESEDMDAAEREAGALVEADVSAAAEPADSDEPGANVQAGEELADRFDDVTDEDLDGSEELDEELADEALEHEELEDEEPGDEELEGEEPGDEEPEDQELEGEESGDQEPEDQEPEDEEPEDEEPEDDELVEPGDGEAREAGALEGEAVDTLGDAGDDAEDEDGAAADGDPAAARASWWRRVSRRLDKASSSFGDHVLGAVRLRKSLDDDFYDDILEVLIAADTGMATAERLVAALREHVRRERIREPVAAIAALKEEMLTLLTERDRALRLDAHPSVVLIVGVNGSGKTTTLGKLAHRLRGEGKSTLLAAADTYRAAAIDQLQVWARRARVPVVAHQPGADPGAVAFDAVEAGIARGIDVVLIDTAGRLHTKSNLMAEMQKIARVTRRLVPEAPHETLLVLDAPTGLNALRQARAFHEATALTGLVLTKLDGTSRGGTVLAVEEELGVPVKLVGMGEGIDDLNAFDPAAYLDALFSPVAVVPSGQ